MKDTEFEALANLTKEAWHVAPSALVSLVRLLCTVGPARARLQWSPANDLQLPLQHWLCFCSNEGASLTAC